VKYPPINVNVFHFNINLKHFTRRYFISLDRIFLSAYLNKRIHSELQHIVLLLLASPSCLLSFIYILYRSIIILKDLGGATNSIQILQSDVDVVGISIHLLCLTIQTFPHELIVFQFLSWKLPLACHLPS